MTLVIGQVIDDRYRILRLLGRGAQGLVYAAEHMRIGRQVAVKVMSRARASFPTAIQRFDREARCAARIGSSHVADVFDAGQLPEGQPYLVMELLDGEPLSTILARCKKLSPAEAFPLAIQILDGLIRAHAAGIIHRDLKPANILLVRGDTVAKDFVKIVDFGTSHVNPAGHDIEQITVTGAFIGTPAYSSPEQAMGASDIDHRSDLYSVGLILYRALTGERPFQCKNIVRLMRRILTEDVPDVRNAAPEIDARAAAIIARATARDPDARYQYAHEFAADLRSYLAAQALRVAPQPQVQPLDPPSPRRRTGSYLLAALFAANVGFVMTPLAEAPNAPTSLPMAQAAPQEPQRLHVYTSRERFAAPKAAERLPSPLQVVPRPPRPQPLRPAARRFATVL